MKKLLYQIPCKTFTTNEVGEEEALDTLSRVEMPWSAENEARAKVEAYNGEYTIEDDGKTAPETTDDVLNALLGVM